MARVSSKISPPYNTGGKNVLEKSKSFQKQNSPNETLENVIQTRNNFFFSIWIYVTALVGSANSFQKPICIRECFASSCNTSLFGYIFCQIHLSVADMHSLTETYLQKDFHSQTKMVIENKEEWKEETSAVWEVSFSHNVLFTYTCLLSTWHPPPLFLFVIVCLFMKKRCDPSISGRTEEMEVLEDAPCKMSVLALSAHQNFPAPWF